MPQLIEALKFSHLELINYLVSLKRLEKAVEGLCLLKILDGMKRCK